MTADDTVPAERRVRDLLDELRRTPAAAQLHDRTARRRDAYEALARHPDPVLREIGGQLRDGTMRPADVLSVPVYAESFQRAAEQAAERLTPEVVAGQLERLVAQCRDEQCRDEQCRDKHPGTGQPGGPRRCDR